MDKIKGIGRYKQSTISLRKGKNYLLCIGINDYEKCTKLNNAVKDIEDFAKLMRVKYDFDPKYIKLLCNENATKRNIEKEFIRLVKEVESNDNVLIYFSGHGELNTVIDEGYWIPFEADYGEYNQYIPNSTIQKILPKINSFHTFLIVDSCYSGSFFAESEFKNLDAYDFPSRWGLTSGRNTIVMDGKIGTNSPFALALLDTLSNIDSALNVGTLCEIIKQTVYASTNKLQIPIGEPLSIAGHKGGQFIFEPRNNEVVYRINLVKSSEAVQKNKDVEQKEIIEQQNILVKLKSEESVTPKYATPSYLKIVKLPFSTNQSQKLGWKDIIDNKIDYLYKDLVFIHGRLLRGYHRVKRQQFAKFTKSMSYT